MGLPHFKHPTELEINTLRLINENFECREQSDSQLSRVLVPSPVASFSKILLIHTLEFPKVLIVVVIRPWPFLGCLDPVTTSGLESH